MKRIFTPAYVLILLVIMFFSCTDTSELENQIDNVENRVSELENLSKQINTNNDYVTNVIEIRDNDKVIGYTFKFSKSESISVLLGKDGDSFFQSVTQDDNNVYLNFIDGTTITLPKEKQLSITFEESTDISITVGATKTLNYSIIGATAKTIVKAMGQNGWSAKVTPADNESGTITVTAPDPLVEDEILVWVYDGETKTIMSSLNFVTGVIEIASNAYSLPKEASSQTVTVNTNIDYIVEIPEEAQSWLSVASTRSAMRTETLTFNLAANAGFIRYATVYIKNNADKFLQTIAFEQAGDVTSVNVLTPGTFSTFFTPEQKANIKTLTINGTLNEYDFLTIKEMTSLQYLDISQISNNIIPNGLFKFNKTITEVKLPKELLEIPDYLFQGSTLVKCELPSKIVRVGIKAFSYSKLSGELLIPSLVKIIDDDAFEECRSLTKLSLNEGLVTIGYSTFEFCTGFTGELIFPKTIKTLKEFAFRACSGFTGKLNIPLTIAEIKLGTFTDCKGFDGDLIIPANIINIESYAFQSCVGIKKIYSKNVVPPNTGINPFPNYTYLGIPIGAKTSYKNTTVWNNFIVIEEVDFEALGI